MVLFAAFSLQDQVEKYGAYVGIAAFFGLAVLTVLYFSQARELRRLRDWAGRAPERAQELEARVTANAEVARGIQAQPIPKPVPPVPAATAAAAVAPAAAAAQAGSATQVADPPEGEAAADGDRDGKPPEVPSEAEPVAAEGEEAPAAQQEAAAPGEQEQAAPGEQPEPPAGEKDEAEPGEPKPDEPAEPAPAAGAQAGNGTAQPEEDEEEDQEEEAEEAPAPAANGGPAQPAAPAPVPIPRATPVPRRAPAPAAPLRQPSRSATLPPRRPVTAQSRRGGPVSAGQSRDGGGRSWIVGAFLGVVILAAVAFGATQILGGDESPPANQPAGDQAAQTPAGDTTPEPDGGGLTPATAKLAVLNGTTFDGLAADQADVLQAAGYTGEIATGNNTEQRPRSSVLHSDGAAALARDVARRLDVSGVQPLDADTRALGENADIVVILGQDKAP